MNPLSKLLWKEKFDYYSGQSAPELLSDIRDLIASKERFSFLNVSGRFISDHEFEMVPKQQFIRIKSFEKETAFLRGQVLQDKGQTQVKFTVRPNSLFIIFFFFFPLIGLILLLVPHSGQPVPGLLVKTNILLLPGILFVVAAPALMSILGIVAKNRLRKEFVHAFNLAPARKGDAAA